MLSASILALALAIGAPTLVHEESYTINGQAVWNDGMPVGTRIGEVLVEVVYADEDKDHEVKMTSGKVDTDKEGRFTYKARVPSKSVYVRVTSGNGDGRAFAKAAKADKETEVEIKLKFQKEKVR
jgi:hypothetical protein